ncbi:hypothetical protein ACFLYU_05600 [Candidatus Dependentiae bacterium]
MIHTIELFPEINAQLILLLKDLSIEDWHRETVLPGRTVKDIASHILDCSLRKLSIQRDGYTNIKTSVTSFEGLVEFIQKMNRDWIEASRRLSPQILISLLELSENWYYDFVKTLNPNDKALFAVAWAGELESKNWFDIARDYTEKWHHQMQIRLAVNKPGINSRKLFFSVIQTFMLGLPHAYRDVRGSGSVQVEVTGEAHGIWYLENKGDKWKLVSELKYEPQVEVKLSGDIAWRLLTDSISKQKAAKHIQISGNKDLAEPFLDMRTVMR